MAKKKVSIEPTIVEEVVPEEVIAPKETPKPVTYKVILEGPKGQSLDYGVNGVMGKLPFNVELELNESIYQAVKAHIKK